MTIIFRLLLTFSSLLLSVFVFFVAKGYSISYLFQYKYTNDLTMIPSMLIYFTIVFLMGLLTINITKCINSETFGDNSFTSIEIANDSFLPSYLGYFFVSLSAASMGKESITVFTFVFLIMSIFIFFSRISFFNPVFLLLKYNFFYVTTNNGVKVILITRKSIKNPLKFNSTKVKRINDYTYLDME